MPDTVVAESARAFLGEAESERARKLIRGCVRCGMCTAVCPTYALTGDELDGPRGRIHLVREMLQNGSASAAATRHLDRCLGCRACETACPSGVRYGELADFGRHFIRENNPGLRPPLARAARAAALGFFSQPALVKAAAFCARAASPLLPGGWRNTLSPSGKKSGGKKSPRKIIALPGCVEGEFAPGGFRALQKIAAAAEVEVVSPPKARCCGALRLHLGERKRALDDISQTARAWEGAFQDGAEAALSPSSGCEAVLREYPDLLPTGAGASSPQKILNPAEFVESEWEKIAPQLRPIEGGRRIAFHAPCTLRNALRLAERAEEILRRAGYELTPVADSHMCCGSAGTYSLLQPKMARELRRRKWENLQSARPDRVATANAGCQIFLSGKGRVVHWLELLAERLP